MPIHIDHLYKVLGKQEVLHDICLDIEDGEVVGLLGPNGAGKSTLMKILLGLWKPTSGTVVAPTTHGYLPELNPLYEYMYVREYLGMMDRFAERPGKALKDRCAERRVEEMMEKVGLMPMANKRIGELSKGYRQRVGIAQAMLGNPELLILDEPTTGLDPNQVVEIRGLIAERPGEALKDRCAERQRITILSTHRLEDVAEVCTRVIILDRGSVKYDSAETPCGLPLSLKDRCAEGQKTLEEIFRQVTNYGK
ncbi:MAG: ABC transporter ATP-binding protein [Paludibacteraceae bacterium]|nr:ABC transporter ATP-binding protein [Paludibacteraceae bacterium]